LLSPAGTISSNLRKLHAAKRAFNKYKPQAVLYIDRLDAGRRDMADLNVSWDCSGGRGMSGSVVATTVWVCVRRLGCGAPRHSRL